MNQIRQNLTFADMRHTHTRTHTNTETQSCKHPNSTVLAEAQRLESSGKGGAQPAIWADGRCVCVCVCVIVCVSVCVCQREEGQCEKWVEMGLLREC